MERLNRIDKNAGNLLRSPANEVKRRRVQVLEGKAIADIPLTAQIPAARRPTTHDRLPKSTRLTSCGY